MRRERDVKNATTIINNAAVMYRQQKPPWNMMVMELKTTENCQRLAPRSG